MLPADYDNDGAVDLVLVYSDGAWFYPGLGDGTFGLPVQVVLGGGGASSLHGAAVVDLDRDGVLDLVVSSQGDLHVRYGPLPTGAFAFLDLPGLGNTDFVAAADLDGDAWTDLVVRAVGGSVIFMGGPAGLTARTDYAVDSNATVAGTVDVCDVDGDGVLDFLPSEAPDNGSTNRFYSILADAVTPIGPAVVVDEGGARGTACADLDRDGALDVMVADDGDDYFLLGPDYTRCSLGGTNAGTTAPTLFDEDGDGDLDVVVGTNEGGIVDANRFYRNTSTTGDAVVVDLRFPIGTCEVPLYRTAFGARAMLVDPLGVPISGVAEVLGAGGRGQVPWPRLFFGVDALPPVFSVRIDGHPVPGGPLVVPPIEAPGLGSDRRVTVYGQRWGPGRGGHRQRRRRVPGPRRSGCRPVCTGRGRAGRAVLPGPHAVAPGLPGWW